MAAPTFSPMRLLLLPLALLFVVDAEAQERPAQADLDEVTRSAGCSTVTTRLRGTGQTPSLPVMERDGVPMDGTGSVRGYVAEPTATGWRLAFGKLNADSAAFHVAYEAFLDSAHTVTSVEDYDEPVARTGFMRDAMLGLEAARSRFPFEQISYNFPVLPAPDGKLYVYVVPAQPEHNAYYLAATPGTPTIR